MKLGNRYQLYSIAVSALVLASCGGSDGKNGDNGASGATGAVSLVKATQLPAGDAHCAAGGVQYDSGLDNGDGGGTAANATLEAGEVDSTQFVCNGATGNPVDPLSVPDGAAGSFFINTKGGSSTAAGSTGRYGGYVSVEQQFGTNGGHIKIAKTGTVDASFTVPAVPASSNYGPAPLVVTATTHVKRIAALADSTDVDGGALAAGDTVNLKGGSCSAQTSLYRWNSSSSADLITGIHIQPGATLSFNHATAGGCVVSDVLLTYAVRNEGTITAGADASGNSDGVNLGVGSYIGTTASSFTLKGVSGGNGGELAVFAYASGYDGSILNFGAMDSSGASGSNGGNGGGISLNAENRTINTGTLISKGGDATSAAGVAGYGGGIDLESYYGEMNNSALLDNSGGNGGTTAGDAGYMYVAADDYNILRNTGELRAIGGTPTAGCAAACVGGRGGNVEIYGYLGDIYHSATVSTYGGNGLTGTGGRGGYIKIYTENYNSLQNNRDNMFGSIWISGTMDSHGGDGAVGGGYGGYFYVYTDLEYMPFGQSISLFGYGGGIDASGGNGDVPDVTGNYGGDIDITQNVGYDNHEQYVPGGSIINTVDMVTKGGNATNGAGAYGGHVTMFTNLEKLTSGAFEKVVSAGSITTTGGNGTTGGGDAGYVYLHGVDGAENHGAITVTGGSASAAAGTAGSTAKTQQYEEGFHSISIVSDGGAVANTGNLSCVGGAAPGAGGAGGNSGGIIVFGISTDNSGTLTANGGNGDTATGSGGDGGTIVVRSSTGTAANTASAMTATGGTGSTGNVGTPGVILINGLPL